MALYTAAASAVRRDCTCDASPVYSRPYLPMVHSSAEEHWGKLSSSPPPGKKCSTVASYTWRTRSCMVPLWPSSQACTWSSTYPPRT